MWKRQAVIKAQQDMGVSQRRACKVVGQPRSTQRYVRVEGDYEKRLRSEMLKLSRKHPRYGYRRVWALLRHAGWCVNHKRIHRLWRDEGLKVSRNRRKKRFSGNSRASCVNRPAEHINDVWAYDILKDRTADGRAIRILTIVDEHTRECLAIEVARSIKATYVKAALDYLFALRGRPVCLRSDNGSEFIERQLRNWLKGCGVEALYVAPASPWENGYAESFNSRLRDEVLNRESFWSLDEAKVVASDYRLEYNHRRPHSSLGYQSPASFAAACVASGFATLSPSQHKRHLKWETLTLSGT